MNRTLTQNSLMIGTFKRTEQKVLELQQRSAQRNNSIADFRSQATALYAEVRSPYIRKRLNRFLAVLDQLEALGREEDRQWAILQRILMRLQNTDLIDHFGPGMQRRMNRLLQHTLQQDLLPFEKGSRWYLFAVGTLHVAVAGRVIRHERVTGRKTIRAQGPVHVFPDLDLWAAGPLYLTILKTDGGTVALYANSVKPLPDLFEPFPLTPVQHTYLTGKTRYGGKTIYVWAGKQEIA